jgi:hypothetical protein
LPLTTRVVKLIHLIGNDGKKKVDSDHDQVAAKHIRK